jgi:hypothetical protein
MAKKATNKKSSKAVKSPAKKLAKSYGKRPAAKAASKAGSKLVGPAPIGTGGGASAAEIGSAVVAHLNSGAHDDTPLWNKYWSKDVSSIEGVGVGMAFHGRKAMEAKCKGWMDENIVHGCRAEGPFIGSTGFAVKLTMDVQERKSGNRRTMQEVAVYTVQSGKVVREEFMYGG